MSSFIKLAGAVAGIAAGAIVLHSQITKPATAPETAPKLSFDEEIVGFLGFVGSFATFVADLADEGIKAFTGPADAATTPAADSAAPEQV